MRKKDGIYANYCNSDKVVIIKEWKKFRRYKDGAEYYGLSRSTFERLAKDANAIHKIDKVVLVNCEIFEKYIDTFRLA